jgi:cytochrome c oxidase assembly protein subunit 15
VWHNNKLASAYRWGLIATAVTCVVVVLGAFTRLSDAGLGCPDWPGCYGHLTWPKSDDAVARAEARFPEFPVEHDKTWPEMVHRYFAGFLGLIILGIAVATWRWSVKSPYQDYPRKHAFALLFLVILQGLFGMWTVTLKLWPQVVTAHLLGGFATLSLLWLFTLRCSGRYWQLSSEKHRQLSGIKWLAVLTLLALIVQIALGGWTSSNYAALACTDLPTCHGEWWPQMDFIHAFNFAQAIGPNYLGGLLENEARTAIHVSHRIGAILVSLLVLLLSWKLLRLGSFTTRPIAWLLLLVLLVQISLGITNVLGSLPLAVAVAHNAVGALLLLVMITLMHRIFTAKSC